MQTVPGAAGVEKEQRVSAQAGSGRDGSVPAPSLLSETGFTAGMWAMTRGHLSELRLQKPL